MSRSHSRTIATRLMVRGDVELVARWWSDPARQGETRSQYESMDVAASSRKNHWDHVGKRSRRLPAASKSGPLHDLSLSPTLRSRSDAPLPRTRSMRNHGVPSDSSPTTGREDLTMSYRLMELSEAGPNQTALMNTVMVTRTGYSWWERAQLRMSESQHRMIHLQERVDRCEADIAAMPQAG